MRNATLLCICAFVFVMAVTVLGVAQTTTGTISGSVTDETGSVLPGAQLSIVNMATGVKRSLTADSAGRFVASQLAPGTYEVSVTMTGFETLIRSGIVLNIGQEAKLTLSLKVGAVTEQVTVTGEAPLLNTSSSAVTGVVEEQRIQELPLNGRDFSQLPLVQPGVSAIRNGDTTVSKGYGTRVSMGGSRPDQTAWLLDGTNIKSMSNFGTPGSAAGVMLGVEAVREFQVLTSNYSAEFGGTSGGVVNMVTKSGTNDMHGSLFEFLRNSKLDARNFFDIPSKPAFKRNQFGGSLGGRIRKDRAFYFGNYEGLRQRLGVTAVSIVPDADARRGFIGGAGGTLQPVTIAPEIRPYLDLLPLPTGASQGAGSGTATLFAPASSPVNENYFVTRVDDHITEKQSIFARFTFDEGTLAAPDQVPLTTSQIVAHTRYATVQHDYIVSPTLLMTTRAAYNRTRLAADEIALISYPKSLELFAPGYLPTLAATGINTFGPGSQNVQYRIQNIYSFNEAMQYIRGAHSMKFGFQFDHAGANINITGAGFNGNYTWNSLTDFLADNRLSAFAGLAPGGSSTRTYMQYVYGTYFQDDWKMRPNFTWNFGLRYGPFTAPTEKWGRISMVKDWVTATRYQTDIGMFKNPSKKNISPRVGFAWDPHGDGKTAVRAGVGLFFVDLLSPYYLTPGGKNPPFAGATASVLRNGQGNLATSVADMALIGPSLLNPVLTPNILLEILDWNLNSSYEMKFNFTVQRQLPGRLSLSVGYLGDRGVHLWRNSDANDSPFIRVDGRAFVPAGTPRVNRNAGAGTTRHSDAQSFYNGLQVELKKNFSHGFQFQTSYTWSKNVDDATTGVANTDFNEGVSSQAYQTKMDRGVSALNVGQNLVINGVYMIPSPVHSGLMLHVVDGWQVSTIFSASGGTPFSPRVSGRNAPDQSRSTGGQRPDVVAGRNSENMTSGATAGCVSGTSRVAAGRKLGTPDLYFDPCAFFLPVPGFYGNAGRNIVVGPGYMNLDFSVTKSTPIHLGEASRLEFRGEFFNLMNRANFALPSSIQVLNPANGQYVAGAGKITKTVGTSRQMQFGLKLIF